MKYMGVIQVLWFKTVKKRRANASVVKSYLDLFQQRIPELLETIVNLSDDEVRISLHSNLRSSWVKLFVSFSRPSSNLSG